MNEESYETGVSLPEKRLNATTDKNSTSSAVFKSKPSSGRSAAGVVVINSFLNKCGLGSNGSQHDCKRTLTIEQELAKLSSIPKDQYEFDSFWQEYSKALPKLSKIARKYLSIPSSSVPSESAFSTSNYILRKNRLGLSSKNVKYTMFLKDKL